MAISTLFFALFGSIATKNVFAAPVATATFGSGTDPVVGTVVVTEGTLTVDLDFTNGINDYPSIFTSDCFDGGLQYHIHNIYENLAESSAFGSTDCGATNLGGHFDPFAACGPSTGNSDCLNKGGCVNRTYDCDFESDPWSCEIGDWSNKYGYLVSDTDQYTAENSSFYEISPIDLVDRGIVIHCNDASRLACASWDVVDDGLETKPDQSTDYRAVVDFSDALGSSGRDNRISLSPDGSYDVEFEFSDDIYEELADTCEYDDLEYYVFEEWDSDEESVYGNDDCVTATGGATYDPSAQCLPFSDNEACEDDTTCGTTQYDCSEDTGYSCSPSDLSGRLGTVSLGRRRTSFSFSGIDYFMPVIDDIIGRSVGVVCGDEILFCGEIQGEDNSRPGGNDDDRDSSDSENEEGEEGESRRRYNYGGRFTRGNNNNNGRNNNERYGYGYGWTSTGGGSRGETGEERGEGRGGRGEGRRGSRRGRRD